MLGADVVDLVLFLALALYVVGMYRVGFVAGALSVIGLLAGGLLALWGLPQVVDQWDTTTSAPEARGVLLVAGTFLAAAVGQYLGVRLGARLRAGVSWRPARTVDSLLGAAGALVVGSALVWLAAGAYVASSTRPAPQAVAESKVLQGIDRVMPAQADRVLGNVYSSMGPDGFPRVFSGVRAEQIRPVDPPAPGVAQGHGVAAAADSIVKVTGFAGDCGRSQTGSGWVVAERRVVTNAHVVAGVDRPLIQIGGRGRSYSATTVAFDPKRDIAVLAVPDLTAEPLPLGGRVSHGDSVVAAGFPLGGPYAAEPGRVREVMSVRGVAIDGTAGVDREIYSINARVQQGNSGGPLLSPSGQVVGTVFAKSPSDASTGYALTLEESRPIFEQGTRSTRPLSTGSCAA